MKTFEVEVNDSGRAEYSYIEVHPKGKYDMGLFIKYVNGNLVVCPNTAWGKANSQHNVNVIHGSIGMLVGHGERRISKQMPRRRAGEVERRKGI